MKYLKSIFKVIPQYMPGMTEGNKEKNLPE
jgi:hypothetical protein